MAKSGSNDAASKKEGWGKGKTDPQSWFKPGCKPGPGRPKGSKNKAKLFREAFGAKVQVALNGKQKTVTKQELGYHQLANKVASGDVKAFAKMQELEDRFDPPDPAPPTAAETAADFKTLDYYVGLHQKFAKPEDSNG